MFSKGTVNILQIQSGAACWRSTSLYICVARVYIWIVHWYQRPIFLSSYMKLSAGWF